MHESTVANKASDLHFRIFPSLTLRCQIEMLTKVSSCTRNSTFFRVVRVGHLAESNEQLKVGKDRKKGRKIKNSFQQQFAYQMPYLKVS